MQNYLPGGVGDKSLQVGQGREKQLKEALCRLESGPRKRQPATLSEGWSTPNPNDTNSAFVFC